jgi:hypothetical protein
MQVVAFVPMWSSASPHGENTTMRMDSAPGGLPVWTTSPCEEQAAVLVPRRVCPGVSRIPGDDASRLRQRFAMTKGQLLTQDD